MEQAVFCVIINDRHTDTQVEVWGNKEKAINRARTLAKENCNFPEDYAEKNIPGWEFFATYSCEDDCVWVIETKVYNGTN